MRLRHHHRGRPARPHTLRSAAGGCLAAALLALAIGGCVRPGPAAAQPDEVFELLHQRQLSGFEHKLAIQRRLNGADAWNRVGHAWLDLVNCTGIERGASPLDFRAWTDGEQPLAKLIYATVILEIRRQNAAALDAASQGEDTLFSRWSDGTFFDRSPRQTDDSVVRWPAEAEVWQDEALAPVAVHSQCSTLDERLLEPPEDAADAEMPEVASVRKKWRRAQLDAAEKVAELEDGLPEQMRRNHLALLVWRARVYGASTALGLVDETTAADLETTAADLMGETDETKGEAGRLGERGLRLIAELAAEEDASPAGPRELSRMLFLRARFFSDAGDGRAALADLRRALAIGLQPPNDERARYLALRLATDQGRWEEALSLAEPLPPRSSSLFSPFAYRVSLAARHSGAEARFLRVAMDALSDARATSPFSSAIYADALAVLASWRFDGRVVEIVEELGPRNELFRRVAQLARAAIERGYADNAEAAARWLLDRHHNHRYSARYRSILAIAAFLQDDEDGFRKQVRAMTRRHPNVVDALGQQRQAEFFADADRTFARLMGQMLPAMAEWGDDAAAESRRQKWLAITVEETQRFLRSVERSKVHPELSELYGLASELLEQHPRGYAARLGTQEPTPLVLGTVRVGRGDLLAGEPTISPSLPQPHFLSLVPRAHIAPEDWRFGWPEAGQGGAP